MSVPRARTTPYVPDFDPYGYSPFDPQSRYQTLRSDLDEAHQGSVRYDDSDKNDHGRHSSSRSRHASPPHRDYDDYDRKHTDSHSRHHSTRDKRGSKVKGDYPREKGDSDWDTDYDPRDKYYLSGDDDNDFVLPSRNYSADNYKPKPERHHPSRQYSSRPSASRRATGAGTRQPPLSRHDSTESASRRRPASSRPKPQMRRSSYNGRPRSARYPPNASRSGGGGGGGSRRRPSSSPAPQQQAGHDFPWDTAMRSALKAGAIAALKMSSQSGSMYEKVPRVATAAIGAAVVDSFMTKRHPGSTGGMRHAAFRQVAELAIANVVAKPAAKGVKTVRHR